MSKPALSMWAVVLPWLLLSRPAIALEYEYRAPVECPAQADFEADTARRLKHPEEPTEVERVVVTVVHHAAYEASVVLHEPGFEPVGRNLSAEDCKQAVQALALATALALDDRARQRGALERRRVPDAQGQPLQSEAVPAPPPEVLPQPQPEAIVGVENPPAAAAPSVVVPVAPGPMDERAPARARLELAPTEWQGAFRASGFAATGYSPRATFGPSVGAALRFAAAEIWLMGFYGGGTEGRHDGLGARFSVLGARLEPCYTHPFGSKVTGLACGSLEGTGVWAEGLDGERVTETRSSVASFWAAGVVAGLRARLTPSLGLSGRFGLAAPLDGHRFRFSNTDSNLHEYPPVTLRVASGLDYLW